MSSCWGTKSFLGLRRVIGFCMFSLVNNLGASSLVNEEKYNKMDSIVARVELLSKHLWRRMSCSFSGQMLLVVILIFFLSPQANKISMRIRLYMNSTILN